MHLWETKEIVSMNMFHVISSYRLNIRLIFSLASSCKANILFVARLYSVGISMIYMNVMI